MLFPESFNAKIRGFRALVRGITDKKFFLFRISKIYAENFFLRNLRMIQIPRSAP